MDKLFLEFAEVHETKNGQVLIYKLDQHGEDEPYVLNAIAVTGDFNLTITERYGNRDTRDYEFEYPIGILKSIENTFKNSESRAKMYKEADNG